MKAASGNGKRKKSRKTDREEQDGKDKLHSLILDDDGDEGDDGNYRASASDSGRHCWNKAIQKK